MLVEVGQRLSRSTRSSDLVARYAGDEFVVVLDGVPDHAAAEQVRSTIEKVLTEPLESVEGQVPTRLASVGLALFPGDGQTAEELVRAADQDMYAQRRASQAHAG